VSEKVIETRHPVRCDYKHPPHDPQEAVAFVAAKFIQQIFGDKREIFGCTVKPDPSMGSGIHFPHSEGYCDIYNI